MNCHQLATSFLSMATQERLLSKLHVCLQQSRRDIILYRGISWLLPWQPSISPKRTTRSARWTAVRQTCTWYGIYNPLSLLCCTLGLFDCYSYVSGDSAYPQSLSLLSPYQESQNMTVTQKNYNFAHSSTRMAIENTNSGLKSKKTYSSVRVFS